MDRTEELISKLVQDTAAVKSAPHPVLLSLGWMGIALVYLLVSLAISGVRHDLLLKFHEPVFVAEIVSLVGIFMTTASSAAILSYPDLHQMQRIVVAPVAAFLLFALTLLFALLSDTPPAPLPVHSLHCTFSIILESVLPAMLMLLVMRKMASTHTLWAGSAAVLSAFSVGAIWLRLYEQNDSIIHLIQWHYLPMLGIAMLGMWLGKAVLKW
jgi:hypothetical protein